MPPRLADLAVDQQTRQQAAEIGLIAHALLDPARVARDTQILALVRAGAAFVMGAILENPYRARVDLLGHLADELTIHGHYDDQLRTEALSLATDAWLVVGDLAALGTVRDVVALLDESRTEAVAARSARRSAA